jgi:tetratricopeptide (TPR) repeat protein
VRLELKSLSDSEFRISKELGYCMLGMIIEQVSGLSYEQYLYQNLFKPAKMEMTGYVRPKFKPNQVAAAGGLSADWGKPTDKAWSNDGPYWHLKGNGGLLTTTEDLYRWVNALKGEKILSVAAKKQLFSKHIKEYDNGYSYYGYGWVIEPTSRGTKGITHNGGNPALSSELLLLPQEQAVVMVLSTVSDHHSYEIVDQIEAMLFDPKHIPLAKTYPLMELYQSGKTVNQIVAMAKRATEDKQQFDYNVTARGLNHFGYQLVMQDKSDQALVIFEYYTQAYPQLPDAFDSYGEVLLMLNRKEAGVAAYKRALTIDPNYVNAEHAKKVIQQ